VIDILLAIVMVHFSQKCTTSGDIIVDEGMRITHFNAFAALFVRSKAVSERAIT
jgi:hypothetical protein